MFNEAEGWMRTIGGILAGGGFLIFWITTMLIYTPLTLNLRYRMTYLDENNEFDESKAPVHWYVYGWHVVAAWIVSLPLDPYYMQFNKIASGVERIAFCRKIMALSLAASLAGFSLLKASS